MSLLSEIRYLRRSASRSPGQAFAVWASTAIWLAVAPAFLTLLGALEWKSLPFPESDRIVLVTAGYNLLPDLVGSKRFQAISTLQGGWFVAEGPRRTVSVIGAVVDPAFFEVFRIRPLAGSVFSPAGVATDAEGAVLTEGLFRQLFGSNAAPSHAVFRTGGRELSVLGVVPDRPAYPALARLWVLGRSGIEPDEAFLPPDVPLHGMVGRLAPGTGLRAAKATLSAVALEVEKRTRVSAGDLAVTPLAAMLRWGARGQSGILRLSFGGLLGLVLLAQVSSLSGFLLEREREFALRFALGAKRLELVRLLLLEAVFLALPGLVPGLPLAFLALRQLRDFVPVALAELLPASIDGRSVAIAIAGWLVVGVAGAAAVWLTNPRIGLGSILVAEQSRTRKTRPRVWARLGLVATALALAVALGAVAATLRQSIDHLQREPLGFEPKNALTGVVRFRQPPSPAELPARLARIEERLAAVPGVTAVAFSDSLPFGGTASSLELTVDRSQFWQARYRRIAGQYFQAAGIRRVAGRNLTPLELGAGAPMGILNETGAHEAFGRRSPLGQTLELGGDSLQVVGVVAATRSRSLDEAQSPEVYVPFAFHPRESWPAVALIARLSPPVAAAELETAVAGAGATLGQVRPLTESVAASLATRRLARDLATLEWLAALALGAVAACGAVSWLLELRAHEHAVRLALGDTRAGIARRVGRGMLGLVMLSSLLGVALYIPGSRLLRTLVFGVSGLVPLALLEAILGALVVVLGASAVAARGTLRRLSLDALRDPGSR